MRWRKEDNRDSEDPDILSHPADTEAWEALDRFDLEFARDPRSVRLGLSTDGFQPHNEASSPYSCWTVFAMPYNLSSNKCLKQGFCIPCPCHSGSYGTEEANEYIFASVDGRDERIVASGRCIRQSSEMSIQLTCCLCMFNP
jgi:hypothetical protein